MIYSRNYSYSNIFGSYENLKGFQSVDSGDAYKAWLEMPGFSKDRVEVTVEGETLKVTASKDCDADGQNGRSLSETILVPQDGDLQSTELKLENGVLFIKIPKIKKKETKLKIN